MAVDSRHKRIHYCRFTFWAQVFWTRLTDAKSWRLAIGGASKKRRAEIAKVEVSFMGFCGHDLRDHAALAAPDAVVRGKVTDSSGRPILGAFVKATAGTRSIGGFSQKDGRYEITLPAGSYKLSAEAYGFAVGNQSKDTAQAGDTTFSLSPRMDVTRLNGAELEALLPDNTETRSLRVNCIRCHTFRTILQMRGSTAAQWRAFLPTMTTRVGDIGDAGGDDGGGTIQFKNWLERPMTREGIATLADLLERNMLVRMRLF